MTATSKSSPKSPQGTRPRWTSLAVTRRSAAVGLPVVLLAAALAYPGLTETEIELDDGGVWVTSSDDLSLGRYNPTIDDLTGGLLATSPALDVRQEGSDVLLVEPSRLSVVDPTSVTVGTRVDVPTEAEVSLAADAVLVTDRTSGRAWLRPLASIATLQVGEDEPDLDVGLGGVVALGTDGVARALTPDGRELEARIAGDVVVTTEVATREAAPVGVWVEATVVGQELVAFDGAVVSLPERQVPVPARSRLQQPSGANASVAVAAPDSLLRIDLGSGETTTITPGSSGPATRPVRVGDCVHAAWAAPERNYVADCGGAAGEEIVRDLEGMTTALAPVFRVNRGRVVLNDTAGGYLWIPEADVSRREVAWDQLQDEDTGAVDEQPTDVISDQRTACTDDPADPLATGDSFGVRPGATVILPVLDNDSSRACGVLSVLSTSPVPEGLGSLATVYDGRALQLSVAPDASGTHTFSYTVSDGRPATVPAQAEVTVAVVDPSVNGAPVQIHTSTVQVEQGGQVRHDVLGDVLDPEGDELRLTGVAAESGIVVTVDPDGLVTLRPDGQTLGRRTVTAVVSDGSRSTEVTLVADVVPAASIAPVLGPVHASGVVGVPLTLDPLGAVLSRGAETVRLTSVGEVTGLTITPDLRGGTFRVTATTPGSYVVPFTVMSGSLETRGLARIDILGGIEAIRPLVATRDVAYLPARGEVTIDPLANDVMTPGTAAFLLEVVLPDGAPVQAGISGHRLLTIRQLRAFDVPVELEYVVSDGVTTARGRIVVVPLPPSGTSLPPVVPDVEVSVRTDGVVTIPVLAQAVDPDGDTLEIESEIVEAPEQGTLYVTGSVLRYQAPSTPGDYTATVSVIDAGGNRVGAKVRIRVHAADAESKAPPRPIEVEARVFAGESVRIDIPLTGIDDDGDLVMLQGLAAAPLKGRLLDQGSTWLQYEALPGEAGTDTFEYAVEDWAGQRARGVVRVVVVPRPEGASTVTAVDDLISVRPGQRVVVPVLDNDTEAGGGSLLLDPVLELDSQAVTASVENNEIVVVAPGQEGVVNIVYTVGTATGGRAQALLTVEVSAEAVVRPPVAADVVVRPIDTVGLTSAEVAVLSVARNPSGSVADLTVSVRPEDADVASVTPSGTVVVALGETMRTVPYFLTSPELPDTPGVAFITVPALGDFPPLMRPRTTPLTVVSGELLQFELSDRVRVAPGKEALVGGSAQATRSDGGPLVVDDGTLQYRSEPGYAGPASLTVEVADGPLTDPTTRTSLLTFPITVLAAEAYPPAFAGTTLELGAGDPAVSVDLLDLTSSVVDASGAEQRYTYQIGPAPAGVAVSLNGSVLTASAPADTPRGTRGTVAVTVSYGGAEPVTGRVEVTVVASGRQLPRVMNHSAEAKAGQPVTVSVLAGAYNPFPEGPLTLTGAQVLAGAGSVSVVGDTVVVTPDAGAPQQMTIQYQVVDVTGEAARTVQGLVTVTVLGPPAAPPAPAGVPGDTIVDLTWSPPASNGSPITEYRVTATPGGIVTLCPTTACTVRGLTNGTAYQFSVVAVNAVGDSPAGALSAPVTPDVIPDAPGAPTIVRGDTELTVSWPAAVTRGTPVQTYKIELVPGLVVEVPGDRLGHTFTGLTNGTSYSVRVQALNVKGPSPWSSTAAGVPAGRPFAPGGLRAPNELRANGDATVTIGWDGADGNGDAVNLYEVSLTGPGGTQIGQVTGTTWSPGSLSLGASYQAQVRARNGVGWSDWSAPVTVQVWGLPGAPGPVSVTTNPPTEQRAPGDGWFTASWSAPASSGIDGVPVNCYVVTVSIGAASSTFDHCGTSIERSNLGNATVTVTVTAINAKNERGASTSGSGTIVTRPAVAWATAELLDLSDPTDPDTRVRVSWSASANGSPVTQAQVQVDGDDPVALPADTLTWTSPDPLDPGSHTIRVRVLNAHGWSEIFPVTVTVPEPPEPTDPPSPSPSTSGSPSSSDPATPPTETP